jgi:hypothetical protein
LPGSGGSTPVRTEKAAAAAAAVGRPRFLRAELSFIPFEFTSNR